MDWWRILRIDKSRKKMEGGSENEDESKNKMLEEMHDMMCVWYKGFAPLPPSVPERQTRLIPFASKSGGFSINSLLNNCKTCRGKGAIECAGCKGTGKNKKNGNIFERWKCFDCQGFGLKSCPTCGKGGLTPEQRGER